MKANRDYSWVIKHVDKNGKSVGAEFVISAPDKAKALEMAELFFRDKVPYVKARRYGGK